MSAKLNRPTLHSRLHFDSKRGRPKEKGKRTQKWMKAVIMDLMEKEESSRNPKDKDRVKHDILNRDTKRRCMEAKEELLISKCNK